MVLAEPWHMAGCGENSSRARMAFTHERDPARRLARDLGDLNRADRVVLLGIGAALRAEGIEILEARAGADGGERHRQRALGRVEADLQRGVGAHREADEMRLVDLEVIEHGERIGVEMLVRVDLGRGGTSDGV